MSDQPNHDAHLQALETLKNAVGPTEEKPHTRGYLDQNEYATLIYYWAGEEHPAHVAEGVINTLANCGWARTPFRELACAGAALALCELYPDSALSWRSQYPELFKFVARAMERNDKGQPGWNDFYIAQWFILRRAHKEEGADIIETLLDRVMEGGTVGYDAKRACETCAVQCKPFLIALQKGQGLRMAMRIIQ